MRLKVIRYNEAIDAHECATTDGKKGYVDLTTDNHLVGSPESLVGKSVEIERLFPFIEIAFGVRIIEEVN